MIYYDINKATNIKAIRVSGGHRPNKPEDFLLRGEVSGDTQKDRLAWLFYLENEAKYDNSCRRMHRNYIENECITWEDVRELLLSFIVEWITSWDLRGNLYAFTIYKLRHKLIDYLRHMYGRYRVHRHWVGSNIYHSIKDKGLSRTPSGYMELTNVRYTVYGVPNIGTSESNAVEPSIDTIAPTIDIDALIDGNELYSRIYALLPEVLFKRFVLVVMYKFTIAELIHQERIIDRMVYVTEEDIEGSLYDALMLIRDGIPGAFVGVLCVETLLDLVYER